MSVCDSPFEPEPFETEPFEALKLRCPPFEPEPLEALKARYPAAIADVFDEDSIKLGTLERFGRDRKNVFDSDDGLRLVVGRTARNCGCSGLEIYAWPVSGDLPESTMMAALFFIEDAAVRFADISGEELSAIHVMGFIDKCAIQLARPLTSCRVDLAGEIEFGAGRARP